MEFKFEKVFLAGRAILHGLINEANKRFGRFWIEPGFFQRAFGFKRINGRSMGHRIRSFLSKYAGLLSRNTIPRTIRAPLPAVCALLLWPNMALAHEGRTAPEASIVFGFFFAYVCVVFAYVCMRLSLIRSFGRETSDDRILNMALRILAVIAAVLPVALVVLGERAPYRLQPEAERPAWSGERRP